MFGLRRGLLASSLNELECFNVIRICNVIKYLSSDPYTVISSIVIISVIESTHFLRGFPIPQISSMISRFLVCYTEESGNAHGQTGNRSEQINFSHNGTQNKGQGRKQTRGIVTNKPGKKSAIAEH